MTARSRILLYVVAFKEILDTIVQIIQGLPQ